MNYDVLKSDRVLIWYDGPMVEVLRDGADYYMTYMTMPGCICARIKKADLIAVLKNEQPMNYVYEKIYKEDKNLGSIKDVNHEIIDNDENGIYIKIKKEDILDVRNYFKSIKMKNNDDFIDLCNKKTWDQADMN